MIKRFCSLLVLAMLILGFSIPSVGAAGDKLVVDMSDIDTAQASGLAISGAYTHGSSFTLRWSGADLSRTVRLPAQADWSQGSYLEFWMYSTVQTKSSFGLAVISDNPETDCVDYYDTVINVDYKGWRLISVPLESFSAVHQPKGFGEVERVELWPIYGGYSIDPAVDVYLESMYVTAEPSEVTEQSADVVLFDLSTAGGITGSGVSLTGNRSQAKAPGKEGSYALCWTDEEKSGLTFAQMPIRDFTAFNTLEISMYSQYASGDSVRIVCRSTNPNTETNDYYYLQIPVDWQGEWKNITLRLDQLSAGGSPLGWDQIEKLEFWWYDSGVEGANSALYIDKITLKNVDYSLLWNEPQYLEAAPEVENQFDFAARINERFPNNEHPRLLATQEEIDWIKAEKDHDEYLSRAVPRFIETCDAYAEKLDTPKDTRSAASSAATLALGFLLTGEQRYADAVWEKMKAVTVDTATWDPGAASMLSVGDTARYVAVAYDLMYNHWTEEQRRIVRNAMVMYALAPGRANLLLYNGAATQDTNWNPVINSGMGMAALALADAEGYADTANQYLNRLHLALVNCFSHYAPDGAGYEGTDYWNYTMSGYLPYENALYNSVGEADYPRFSILDEFGMEKTGDYILQMHGTTGLSFNYYDGAARGCYTAGDFWLARYFDRSELAGMAYEGAAGSLYYVLMYRPNEEYKNWRSAMPLDYTSGGEVQAGAMRTSFDKGNQGFYVGYKGNGGNVASHGRLDAGTFVLDALGTRWVELLSSEDYNLPGMFGTQRYKYYRNRAEGSNTLVIGPGVHQGSNIENDTQATEDVVIDQVKRSDAPIETAKSEEWASYSILDLTGAYRETADSAKRGFALLDGRNAFLLQDEITVKSSCDIYSFLHTQAVVEIAPDGQSAILTRNGKQLRATLLSNCGAVLMDTAAEPFATSPDVENSPNDNVRRLTIKARAGGSATFSLLFTPYYGEDSYEFTMDEIVPMSQWDSFLGAPVPLNGIYLDGVPLSDFAPGKTAYTLKEDSCGTITAAAEPGVKVEVLQAEKVGETAVIKATNAEGTTTNYAVTYSDAAQRMLDEWSSYPAKDYLYSANRAEIPNVIDGDTATGWANEGSQWLAFDLGAEKPVHEVQLYWNNQTTRQETFDIQVSNDGETWQTVWEGESVLSDKMEAYSFDPVMARYVKVTGYYNTDNNWTTICEMRVTYSGSGFDDLDGCWAQQAIEDMAKIGLLEGTADRVFSPDEPLSRAAFLTMLARAFGLPEGASSGRIPDVAAGSWYTPYVESAYESGLIPDAMLTGGFLPDQDITREEIAALSVSFYEHFYGAAGSADLTRFVDRDDISDWAETYISKCLALRFITGMTEDSFVPGANATRAQAAAILKRIYVKIY